MIQAPAKPQNTCFEEETTFRGNLSFDHSLTIRGRFEGSIRSKGTLVIESNARVKADIEAVHVIIAGEVEGDVVAYEILEMTDTSHLNGNIKTKKLKLAEGVEFEGKCEMLT